MKETKRRTFLKRVTAVSAITILNPNITLGTIKKELQGHPSGQIILDSNHLSVAQRSRRIVVNLDTGWGLPGVEGLEPKEFVDAYMEYLTGIDGSQVDSIWWCWGEMNYAPYPSKILPANLQYQKWLQQGKDPLPIVIESSKKKGIEAFYSFRINDSGLGGAGTVLPSEGWIKWSMIEKNPHWGQPSPFWPSPFHHYNFAVPEVREYKLAIIREVVENYDFDGIEIDWRCGYGCLPFYHKWENREHLTEFMCSIREMLQERARKRGRPFLLAVRVPENIEGCHYDGIHVERWVEENLVDILVLGCKNFDVDLDAFKCLTAGTHIKLYPSMDDHHRASGYEQPSIELYRGVASTFMQQGADGIYAFNWYPVPIILDSRANPEQEQLRRTALCEMGSTETLKFKDKIFVTGRRGGGGWPETAEYFYKNTCAFAQLPKELSNNQSEEAYIFLRIGDDIDTSADKIEQISLRILLSDVTAIDLPWEKRISKPVCIARLSSRDFNEPPTIDLISQLRIRINGVILEQPIINDGWIIYPIKAVLLAQGSNVIAFRLNDRNPLEKGRVTIEKLELDVRYTN
jgi:hypothetical protein